MTETRRGFLAASVGSALLIGCNRSTKESNEAEEEDVTPTEDLMREHGVLDRLLLIFETCAARLDTDGSPIDTLPASARIIRTFIQDYHERSEEQHLFPRFLKANVQTALVATLMDQHRAGRALVDTILDIATPAGLADGRSRLRGRDAIRAFVRMYRPHAAREDTVLFVGFRKVISRNEFTELGDRFEDDEHRKFGPNGFASIVEQVAQIERALAIDDLAMFTPAQS